MTERPIILVVDDDAIFRRIMAHQLEQLGFAVEELQDGRDVPARVSALHPVACIIDMVMPEKEGMETVLQLSLVPQPPKIIGVSANSFYLGIAQSVGADACLHKPVEPEELRKVLTELGLMPET